MSRAESILGEGFRAPGGAERGIYFAQDPSIARSYARGRARNERDKPAVIMCLIDLGNYRHRNYGSIYSFQHERIGSEVIVKISGLGRISSKLRDSLSFSPKMSLDFHSSCAAIAYWVNSFPALIGDNQIRENHPAVTATKQWLISQADAGRSGAAPDEELLRVVMKSL